jgi:hypothetical protein
VLLSLPQRSSGVVWCVRDCGCDTVVIWVGRYLGPKVGKPLLGYLSYWTKMPCGTSNGLEPFLQLKLGEKLKTEIKFGFRRILTEVDFCCPDSSYFGFGFGGQSLFLMHRLGHVD